MPAEDINIVVNEESSLKDSPSTNNLKDDVLNDENIEEILEEPKYNLQKFQLKRILQNNTVRKSIALLGSFPDLSQTDRAIVLFEKEAFKEKNVQTIQPEATNVTEHSKQNDAKQNSYFNAELQIRTEFINNIYGSFKCIPSAQFNGLKTTVVYPATDKHIEKYSISNKYIINETPEFYKNITLPYIEKSQFSLEWVYNILEHKQETERVVYEDKDPDTGFILLPDLKWDGRNVESLYLLALPFERNIKSLRDLTGEHLPLLKNIRKSAAAVIEERYSLLASQLRMYIHYQPSFYHLHVHINPVRSDAPGIWCEKSHMLDTVINNLELIPDYYSRATIPFILYDSNELLNQYQDILRLSVRKRKSLESGEEEISNKRQKLAEDEDTLNNSQKVADE